MTADEHPYLLDALNAIDPATLDYQSWVDCGMSLHESGYSWQDWEDWSRRDPARFHEGECERKWRSFGNGTTRVNSGTIIHMAEQRGWHQPTQGMGTALDWDGVGAAASGPDVTSADVETVMDADEGPWDPCRMLGDYLGALFDDDELVCYVNEVWERDGDLKPTKGHCDRTAGQLRQELAATDDVSKVLGDWNEKAGAWVCFNPLDGKGRNNSNVTDYRYALVESDKLELDKQLPAIRELNLPCAAVVSSAGKSVHAIVRIDAGSDAREYAKRVQWLYDYCDRHGFVTDRSNKNGARLSRLPGVTRNGRRQLLLATNIGPDGWESWRKWAEESEDDLPDEIVGGIGDFVERNPILIGATERDGILRKYSKMMLVGDSKMGKSTTLIDLAQAICAGGEWLGMQCAQGKVYYINLELDEKDFRCRMNEIWNERPEAGDLDALRKVNQNFVHMPMKGRADLLWEIAPTIVRRVLKYGPPRTFAAIIIDPIYKVNGGDDNDAKSVAHFTNTLDLIAQACGCAIIYAHHHPKGTTGNRRAIDRMSGSGVYGRDADTVIDFSPLFVPDELWQKFDRKPLYRAEITCRGFGPRKPIDCAFRYPRFYRDTSGMLAQCKILGEDPGAEGRAKGAQATKEKAKDAGRSRLLAINDAFEDFPTDDFPDAVEFDEDFVTSVRWSAFGIRDNPTLTTVSTWIKGTSKAKFVSLIQEHFELMHARGKTYLRRLKVPETTED